MQYVNARNVSAHQSFESFAALLTTSYYKDSEVYFQWRDAFPLVCKDTIEELSKSASRTKSALLRGTSRE